MQIFHKVKDIQDYLTKFNNKSIGFVATMGALHQGHLSLLKASNKQNHLTICSIYVNPKQFNKEEDLVKYPRNTSQDIKKLEKANCDVAFIPNDKEVYPKPIIKNYDFGLLSKVMEAEHRPGHFKGVATVIERLFEILNPTNAYFGEKDFQQLAIIKSLVKQIKSPVNIIGCPICREKSGLALSSRNERLSEKEKKIASKISESLKYVANHKNKHSVSELKVYFHAKISKTSLLEVEYFEIADKETLSPIKNWSEAKDYVAFAAVHISGVRLIDNMTIIN